MEVELRDNVKLQQLRTFGPAHPTRHEVKKCGAGRVIASRRQPCSCLYMLALADRGLHPGSQESGAHTHAAISSSQLDSIACFKSNAIYKHYPFSKRELDLTLTVGALGFSERLDLNPEPRILRILELRTAEPRMVQLWIFLGLRV